MTDITEYIYNNNEEQVNEGLLAVFAVLLGASLLAHIGFKTFHKAEEKCDAFWNWVYDSKGARH